MKRLFILTLCGMLHATDLQQEMQGVNTTINTAYSSIVTMLNNTSTTIDQTLLTINGLENNALTPLHTTLTDTLLPLLKNALLIKAGLELAGIGDITDVLQDVNDLIQYIIQTLDNDIKPPLKNIQQNIAPTTSPVYRSLSQTKQSVNALLQ